MNKYDTLMREIVDYLKGTRLDKASKHTIDKGSILGSTYLEIRAAEQEIGKKLPAALKAWYRAAGAVPPYLNDYDADYSLQDLKRAQVTAFNLTQDEECQWQITDHILPFSQRIGEQFLFVDTSKGIPDDPPVYHFMEGHELPKQIDVAFSACNREMWLQWLDFGAQGDGIKKEQEVKMTPDERMARKRILDHLNAETRAFRQDLVNRVYEEDLTKDVLTGPRAFQERWKKEFAASEVWQMLKKEGLRFPYDFIDAPK
jgi:hypothetical protein